MLFEDTCPLDIPERSFIIKSRLLVFSKDISPFTNALLAASISSYTPADSLPLNLARLTAI